MAAAFCSPSRCCLFSHSTKPLGNPNRLVLTGPSRPPLRASTAVFARRKKAASSAAAPSKIEKLMQTNGGVKEDVDKDAFEALFAQLEEDLKNDKDLSNDGTDDEITEEDLAMLEKELEEAFGDVDMEGFSGSLPTDLDEMNSDTEEEIQRIPKLKNWQVRRLASALKVGRRKTNIKNLAAELGLDRALVLELLRDPPPNLLMMSASLPDKIVESPVITETAQAKLSSAPEVPEAEPEPKKNVPVHVMRASWSKQKRLKKVQVATLEKVYRRSKRPTNSMISSIVYVTNLPWKTVVKWFEDRRREDGVPEQRVPFQRSTASISSR